MHPAMLRCARALLALGLACAAAGASAQAWPARQKAVVDPEVRARLDGMGVAAVGPEQATPAALRAHLKNEIDTLGGLLLKAGVKAN